MPKRRNQLRKLGRALRDARLARNLRLREVAAMVGVTGSVVSGYEQGVKEPPALRLLTAARVLGVNLDALAEQIATRGRPPLVGKDAA